jgi:signal transduction histidine kinase
VRRRLARLSERDWRVVDRLFAGVVLLVAELNVVFHGDLTGPLVANMAVLGVMSLSLLWRRSHPLAVLAVVLAGATLMTAFLTPPPEVFGMVVLILSACYATGRHLEGRRALIGLVLGVGTVATVAVIHDPGDVVWPAVFFAGIPWLAGRTLRNQTQLARELAEKAERAAHAREEEERRAIAAERTRIARELHDVVAHNLSVMVVQASAARRVLERDPERAAEAAELIRRAGRDALAELRHVFGPVRRGDGEELTGPPSIARVDELARGARAAGLKVRLRVEGEPVPLPTALDQAAYRVVQEALTNALKHAGSAHATVTVSYEPGEVVLSIEDDGAAPASDDGLRETGGGHGLVGMRERVALYGGVLQAGPREQGGFAVRARLPTRPLVPGGVLSSTEARS